VCTASDATRDRSGARRQNIYTKVQPHFPHFPHFSHPLHKLTLVEMDSLNLPDVANLPDRDKQELQQFIRNETQKGTIQQCKPQYLPVPALVRIQLNLSLLLFSHPFLNRHVLPQMHKLQNLLCETRQIRRTVHAELR